MRGKRSVMFVGNNWAGTATVVDTETLEVLRRGIDLVPDVEQELAAIRSAPERLAFYLAVQQGPGEGHDRATTGTTTSSPAGPPRAPDGTCWISLSESDAVAVLDVRRREEIAYLSVGDHPQRVRHGVVREEVVAGW